MGGCALARHHAPTRMHTALGQAFDLPSRDDPRKVILSNVQTRYQPMMRPLGFTQRPNHPASPVGETTKRDPRL